jgi:archaellum biogenesis ATPase FlaH/biotin operon repressor
MSEESRESCPELSSAESLIWSSRLISQIADEIVNLAIQNVEKDHHGGYLLTVIDLLANLPVQDYVIKELLYKIVPALFPGKDPEELFRQCSVLRYYAQHEGMNPEKAINDLMNYLNVDQVRKLAELFGIKWSPTLGDYVSAKELFELASDLRWIIPGLIPLESGVFLAGKAGEGKSILSLFIAKDVASQENDPDGFKVEEKGKVVIFDRENHPAVLKIRVKALGMEKETNVKFNFSDQWYFDEAEGIEFLERFLASEKPILCIFDSWTQFISHIDENKAIEVNNVIRELRRLAREYKCAFLIIHHLRKGLPYALDLIDELRGSSAIANTADIVLLYRGEQDRKLLQTIKSRMDSHKAYLVEFIVQDGRFNFKIEETKVETETSEVVKAAERVKEYLSLVKRPATRGELAEELSIAQSTLTKALQYLLAMGTIERVKKGVYRLKQNELPLPGAEEGEKR